MVEITFSGERGYQKDLPVATTYLPVATAMKLVASGTYSQTSQTTIDYDFSTESSLSASGVVTTTGTGKASIAGSSRTWWNGGTGEGSLTAANGASVSHTENGNRTSSATLATDWVFAGGGWQEQETVFDTSGASNGSFASSHHHAWYAPGDPEQGDGVGSYAKGDFTTRASGSHDYTSSSELTRQAAGDGGFAVTGWRKGGGESHGTSHVHLDWTNTREWYRKHDLTADDAYDYTDDEWEVTFDADGMPTVTYAGTLVMTGGATWSVVENFALGNETTDSGLVPEQTVTQTRSAASDAVPGFMSRGGPSWTTSLWSGYGTSFAVDGAGYGYSESSAVPDAFGRGLAPDAATPPATPAGASTVPKGVTSEAANYEARLAGLSKPRLVTSGSRPLGSGSANLPTMPTVTTPAIGALGFTKSDSAPETPQTRAFASLVTSGMAAPVGAMADSGGSGMLDWIIGDARQVYENTEGMSPAWRAYVVGGFWLANATGVRGLSDAFSTNDAADGHVQSWSERTSDGVFGALGLAGTTSGLGRAAIAAANKVDDVGRCMNALTKINLGACFTGDTLVQVTALAGAPSTDPESAAAVATATLQTVAIASLPLGSRVLAGNPRTEELDDSFAEPEQATWVTVSVRMTKRDSTVVKAEFLRPRDWVARRGIKAGAALPMAIAELEVEGDAVVTAIGPCPQIAEGEGRVVTGRFVTRAAGNLIRVALENGTEIRVTDVHPVWSVDREEWMPAEELEPGGNTPAHAAAVNSGERQSLDAGPRRGGATLGPESGCRFSTCTGIAPDAGFRRLKTCGHFQKPAATLAAVRVGSAG